MKYSCGNCQKCLFFFIFLLRRSKICLYTKFYGLVFCKTLGPRKCTQANLLFSMFFLLQIILTYNTTINESRVVWTEPGLGNNTRSSYLMCQMKWHTVRVTKQGPNITITLDELHSVSSPVRYGANMTGELFLGGYAGKLPQMGVRSTEIFVSQFRNKDLI